MFEGIRHNCGYCVGHSSGDCYSFTSSEQHRGREGAGMLGKRKSGEIDVLKWVGPVSTFDSIDLDKIFPPEMYDIFFGHVRYATRGRKEPEQILRDAHPHVIGGKADHRGDHIFITGCDMAIVHNGQVNPEYLQSIDERLLRTGCDTEALLHLFKQIGEFRLLAEVPGAYTLAIADKSREEIIVLRDRTGIKPGVLGQKGKYCAASEDVAFTQNGAKFIEDLEPGSVYYIYPDGKYVKKKVIDPDPSYCFFEYNYLAHVDSVLNRVSVRAVRQYLGEALAEEFQPDADLVTFLPRCPESAAIAYADKLNLPFKELFYKMRGERSFQGSTPDERERSINTNLHGISLDLLLLRGIDLSGKRIVVIDDSMVRGNNSRRAIKLLYNEGAEKVYLTPYTPPIGIIGDDGIPRGCMYGVDMPPDDNFIARGKSLEEISESIHTPTHYLSPEGMFRAFFRAGIPREHLCTYCIGGEKPF